MACVVYCLVPDPEQLDPLVERLKDAGVKTEDIAVVPRRHWPHPAQAGPARQASSFTDSTAFSPGFWGLALTPAGLWWQWAVALQASAWPPQAGGHAVIPLEIYENKLGALKRK